MFLLIVINMQMSYFLCIGLLHVRTCQVVFLMMQKWLFVIEVSVFNVFFYLYSFYYDFINIHEYAN